MKKSRFSAMILAGAMALSMTACGGSQEGETTAAGKSDGAQAASEDAFVVGICQLQQHEALDAATQGFKDALVAAFGDKVTFCGRYLSASAA